MRGIKNTAGYDKETIVNSIIASGILAFLIIGIIAVIAFSGSVNVGKRTAESIPNTIAVSDNVTVSLQADEASGNMMVVAIGTGRNSTDVAITQLLDKTGNAVAADGFTGQLETVSFKDGVGETSLDMATVCETQTGTCYVICIGKSRTYPSVDIVPVTE